MKVESNHTLIAGGSRGIGAALAKYLAKTGHLVSVLSRKSPQSEYPTSSIRHWELDVRNPSQIPEVLSSISEARGEINNLIISLRYRGEGEDWTGEMETGPQAARNLIEHLIKYRKRNSLKSIVVVSSVASMFVADEQSINYHMARAALDQLVRYFAVLLGPKGIRVNSVLPSIMQKEESKSFYLQQPKLIKMFKDITPLGRMGNTDDIGGAVRFLCSREASFLTGQEIIVDGGLSLRGQETVARQVSGLTHPNLNSKSND
jgi:NAD(P)-dependent dehydrogenase (short-subunit alcohol dehydrogenase family)